MRESHVEYLMFQDRHSPREHLAAPGCSSVASLMYCGHPEGKRTTDSFRQRISAPNLTTRQANHSCDHVQTCRLHRGCGKIASWLKQGLSSACIRTPRTEQRPPRKGER